MYVTQVGLMIGVGAAKTGLFWISGGTEEEEDGDGGLLSRAKTAGRNVALRRKVWAGDTEEMEQPLMEVVDIVQRTLEMGGYIDD